jgi:D-alanyl-D-alanine carboxypeptidase
MADPSAPRIVTAVLIGGRLAAPEVRPVPWWSFTKPMIAAAALALVREGMLTLDVALAGRPYTLRQLLQHTAGVPNYTDLPSYRQAVERGDTPWSTEDMLVRVGAETLQFEPGTEFRYSNTGYALVRRLIEMVTGHRIGDALTRLVLSPLGVADAWIADTPHDVAATEWGNPIGYHPHWVYHGLMIGSPAAAVRLLHGVLESELLPRPLRQEMRMPRPLGGALAGRPFVDFGYGLGLMISRQGPCGGLFGHSGRGPDSVSAVYFCPDLDPPRTVAAFARGDTEYGVEWAAIEAARGSASTE